ncbi:MAG: glycosyltransferase family 39 protein [Coxiellaceae bacterium]|nr:glycosyltransferase family 39 protein [Coxiellaceae bacterium]
MLAKPEQQLPIRLLVACILGVVVLTHLYILLCPYLHPPHTWRQGDTAAVARNFYRESMNLFLPRIDSRGNLSGINGMEFPLYNYCVAIIYKITGTAWIGFGRILSFIFSLVAVWFLSKINRQQTETRYQSNNLLVLLVAYSVPYFSQFCSSFMPEMMAMMLMLISFYAFFTYIQHESISALALSSVSLALAILIRPYYIFLALPYVTFFISQLRISARRSVLTAIFGLLPLVPFFTWYHYWVPHLNNFYGAHYFYMGIPLSEAIKTIGVSWWVLLGVLCKNYFGYIYLPFFALGCYAVFKQPRLSWSQTLTSPIHQLLYSAILTCLVLPLVVGSHYKPHLYFLGAVFPAIAIYSALGFQFIYDQINNKKLITIILTVLFALIYAFTTYNINHVYKPEKNARLMLRILPKLQKRIPKNALVVIDDTNRMYLYILDRKGWAVERVEIDTPQKLSRFKRKGAKYLLRIPRWKNKHDHSAFKLYKL